MGVIPRKASCSHGKWCQHGGLSTPQFILETRVKASASEGRRFVLGGSYEKVLNRQEKRGTCPICFGTGRRKRVFNKAERCSETGKTMSSSIDWVTGGGSCLPWEMSRVLNVAWMGEGHSS